ncbi:SDR family oxidoreductase [Mangrovimonas sp. AS39]|uniref:SDR family NAD(P)-dependent oxidoreductase n=1 Tax=Mangrovimonas futianensis TaxID=2895523 RepID=UPI001E489229|nr:SDR family oxidoreductase [Mangrovimonas futianensis]MCF1192183.1 SDR family oxidoreductase [Mangrovimonas futianensis]MCF1196068.1 SDR family oxidoreductase [Mangrovimonas futianensis]
MTKTKIALVTGGSRGLGENMALSLAQKGLDVILTFNQNSEKADDVVNRIKQLGQKAAAIQLNVSAPSSFNKFFDQVQEQLKVTFHSEKFDFLINNAGVGIYSSFMKTTEEQLDLMYQIHFKSVFMLTQAALPIMNNGGGIVNISSGLTRFAIGGYAAYSSMKTAIETLSKYQAKELGERKIRCNVVAPGAIETDFGGGAVRDNQDLNAFIASNTALGRVGLPDDIGGVVAFLCTEDAKWITAQRIEVSGGQMI